MASIKTLVVAAVLICSVVGQQGDKVDVPPEPPVSPASTSTSTTQPTPSPSPTTKPTSPTPTTTTTTTVTPTTTTSVTPTTKPTPAPTTAPPPAPTTPSPAVDPKVGNWAVNFTGTNRSCIVLEAALQYEILEPKSNKTIKINVPENATATGSCEPTNQILKLSWNQNNLEFNFNKSNTSFELEYIRSTLNITVDDLNITTLIHNASEFSTPLANSYKCDKEQTLNFTQEKSNITAAYLHVTHLQYQAFHNSTEHKFDSALDCEGSTTPDVVPIVVGCVLAALVIMVLIAYLVGRRRCQARGYLSM